MVCKVKFHKRLIKIISDIFGDVLCTDGKLLWWGGMWCHTKKRCLKGGGKWVAANQVFLHAEYNIVELGCYV